MGCRFTRSIILLGEGTRLRLGSLGPFGWPMKFEVVDTRTEVNQTGPTLIRLHR